MLPFDGLKSVGHPKHDHVYRRITPAWVLPVPPDRYRLTTQLFQPRSESDGVSVIHGESLTQTSRRLESVLLDWETYGLMALEIDQVLALGLTVELDQEFGDEPGHALIRGQLSKSTRKRLLEIGELLKWPEPLPNT